MDRKIKNIDNLLKDLQERAKELNCLYKIEELLSMEINTPLKKLLQSVVEILPSGWQYPEICQAKIIYGDHKFESNKYVETIWVQTSDICVQENIVGLVSVSYRKKVPKIKGSYFIKEEVKLINTVADRIGHTILHHETRKVIYKWEDIKEDISKKRASKWQAIMDTLKKSDKKLFIYISRKMLRNLCLSGIEEANILLKQFDKKRSTDSHNGSDDINRPSQRQTMHYLMELSNDIFHIASENMSENQILSNIEKWMLEDRSKFLVRAIDDPNSSLNEIIDAITRYKYLQRDGITLSTSVQKGLKVSLARRFLYDQLEFIKVAKNYIDVSDYYDIVDRIIFHSGSHGNLGGKSAGLFLATNIISKMEGQRDLLKNLKVPKTWYITSDGLIKFLYYNHMEDVNEQKYKDIEEIRLEYPNIVQIFKNSQFPPKIINGLSAVIEDSGSNPLIVRSSSILEDRLGAAFSGKYKSLFLANQGTKKERLEALVDAIAEVYASTFAPDPIEYRMERGLLDFFEQMGILIQEVVGTRIGNYFLPSFAGVAFSNNEFCWSTRIKREDGLIRLVPGLGTRAVDRLSDDYPILVAPGKPKLRVNHAPDEILKYAPKMIDVINLENNTFETIELSYLFKKFGNKIPAIQHIVSIYDDNMIHNPTSLFNIDFEKDELVVTFEGLFKKTPFIQQIKTILQVLKETIGSPVDIEFAHDGTNLYLLQCRPQSFSTEDHPAKIPKNIPNNKIIFSANKYISNGSVYDITHIVYVDPDSYKKISDLSELQNIGRIVGKLNKLLPKKQFILMGPGRWGSRGDIKLGVDVTYSDINNTAILIEIATKSGNYVPELSFGTHFFQDLVEASIRYLPLYPDDKNITFNNRFFTNSQNILPDLLPKNKSLSKYVKVIDIPKTTGGLTLRVLMNSEQETALGFLTSPE